MRFPRWPLAAVVLVFASAAARGNEGADPVVEARECIGRLASTEADVRREAAERIVELDWKAVEETARRGADLDEVAWKAFADACDRSGRGYFAIALVAAAHKAPEAHRTRILALANRLDPTAGKKRTAEEVATEVRRVLVESSRARCLTGFAESISVLGHDAVPVLLDAMRNPDPEVTCSWTACNALVPIAEREDVPALRELLLAGETDLARVLGRLQERGFGEATDALLDGVAAGELDDGIAEALAEAPDRLRTARILREFVGSKDRPAIDADQRGCAAWLFAAIGDRESVPTLEAWSTKAAESHEFMTLGTSLTRLGSRRGIEILVLAVGERPTRFPCRPSTPAEKSAASSPGRMCSEGFHNFDRSKAARVVSGIAGQEVFETPLRKRDGVADWDGADDETLDRAAIAFRAWWDASKDRLRFDPAAGSWSLAD